MGNAVQDALKAREKRKQKEQKERKEELNKRRDAVSIALNAYRARNSEGVDQDYINSFFTDASTYLGSAEDDYNKVGWSNASSTYEARKTTADDLTNRASHIRSWLERNVGKLDTETYSKFSSDLNNFNEGVRTTVKTFKDSADYYSKWKTEDEYNKDIKAAEEMMSYDLEAGKSEIDRLNNILGIKNEITKLNNDIQLLSMAVMKSDPLGTNKAALEKAKSRLAALESSWAHAIELYGGEEAIRSIASEKNQYYTLAKRAQEGAKLGGVSNPESENYDPKFKEYSTLGSNEGWENVGSKTHKDGIAIYDDLKTAALVMNERRLGKELFSEDMVTPKGGIAGYFEGLLAASEYNTENRESVDIFREMNDNEVDTLAYYLQKDKENGTNFAEQYVSSIRLTLNQRMAEKIAAKQESLASKYIFSAQAALDQFFEGRDALFSDADFIPPSATQYASGIVRESLSDSGISLWYNFKEGKWENKVLGSSTGQIFYDVVNTTSNMLPSVLASALTNVALPGAGSYVGAVFMGMGAAGNAKAEMLNLGYSKEQANTYGVMVGISEAVLEKVLGGIPGLKSGDGVFSSIGQKMLGKIDNTLARVAITIGGNMLDEGLEEGLQTILEPWMAEIATNVDWDDPTVDEVLYSSLLGALSSIGFTSVDVGFGAVKNKVAYNKQVKEYGQRIIDKGSVEGLRSEASKLSDNKTIAKLSNKLSKKMSARNVGKLAVAIQAETNARDKSAMVADLVSKGLSQREAQKVTEFVTRTAQGYEATEEEIAEIEKITDKLPDVEDSAEYSVDEYGKLIAELETESGNIAEAGKMVETDSEATVSKTEQVDVEDTQGVKSARESAAVGAGEAQSASVIKNAATKENATESRISTFTKVADAEESPVTLESASKKYGAQAGAMKATYIEGQDIATYDAAYRVAYDMGKSGVNLSYAMQSESTAYLTESQRELAHAAGVDASNAKAKEQDAANKAKANGKNRRRKGVVRGRDVSISDLKARFNDKQGVAYKLLSFYAEATGIDIVLYDSSVNEKGEFEEAQGKFKWSEDTIYIDINAGLAEIKDVNDLAKYTMMRTFSHEFVHFIEKWNPIWYNEFRKVVFDTLTERGENVDDLIATKQAQSEGMSYDKASREVVAEAMTDILPDAHFAEKLATKHKNIFYKLLDMLKEFVADLKAYFNSIGKNPSREANALKEQVGDSVKYLDHIVELFDKVAIEAVENYQAAVAVEDSIYDSGAEAVNNDYETLASYGLTDEEIYSVLQYKSSESYKINEKLYTNAELNSSDLELMRNLDRALEKIPVFQGTVYRNMIFDSKESLVAFLRETLAQGYTRWASYTSTSKTDDGYEVDGDYVVHIEIDSLTGRDLSNIGIIEEQEVLLPRDAMFVVVDKLLRDDGHVYIKLQEVEDGQNETLDRRGVGGLSSEIGDRTREEKTDDRGGTRRVVQETISSSRESERVDRGRSEEKRARAEVGEELDEKSVRHNEITKVPAPKEEQSIDSVDEDTVQEQSRNYLEEDYENGDVYTRGRAEGTYARRSGTRDGAENRDNESLSSIQRGKQGGIGSGFSISDSEGRGISPETFDKIRNTNIVDKNGNPIAVYHFTPNMDFDQISKSNDVGFHSGTIEQAIGRSRGSNGRIFRSYYNIQNPLHMRLDIGSWKPQFLTLYLQVEGYISESENAEIKELIIGDKVQDYNSPASIRLREILAAHGYDGIAYPNGVEAGGDSYIAFEKEQIITTEILKYENGEVLPGEDIQYQRRTNTLTDRDALYMAAEKLGEDVAEMSEAERDALQIFKDRLSRLYDLQEERVEQGRLYKEQQFGASVDREAAARTLNRMHVLDDQIKKANEDVLSIEGKKILVEVLKKARGVIEAEQKTYDAEILKRYRDRTRNAVAIKKYRERIRKDVNDLSQWILKPNNKDIVKHVPAVLKNSVIPFLSSIDFTSKQQLRGGDATQADKKFLKRLESLNAAMKDDYDVDGLYSGYTDLPADFMDKLESLTKTVRGLITENSGEFVINKMTSEELKTLASVVRNLKTCITQTNKFHANAMFSHVYEAGDNTIAALAEMASNDGRANAVSNFVFWQQIRPAFAFERFGEGGKAVYDGLRRGQAQLAFNTKKIVEFTEKAYTDKEVTAWEKEIKEIKISKGIVKMRVSDIMSFYELSKQPDSLRQMLGAGMRVATYTSDGKKISDNGHALIEQDITSIVDALTPRQKEVADALQKFMQEQGGAWGNYVSVARFGEELFTNEQYFPINSDGRHLQVTADEAPSAASLYALLNMSFTKSRNEKANNRIIVYSIFDVFANHMASMAQYNALALPVLDAIKWLNYQKTEDADGKRHIKDSVREQMDRVYGVPVESKIGVGKRGYAQSFVLNIIKAFSGTEAQGVSTDTMGMNALKRYNVAQVAYNLRVVVQQPLAITRAALLIDYESIMRGMKLSPSAIKQNIKEMREYSGIAAWKALGFYDVNISRGLADTIKHNTTVVQKIDEIGMWGAEKADTLTWAAIWSACKEEVTKKQSFKSGDVGFYEAVTRLFEEVVYKTQVVDSVLTKNEYLRSKGMLARLMGSFMSEPTTTASMVVDAVDKYNADRRRGMTRQQAWGKNRRMIGRTIYVYAMSAVILAAVQAVADAFRDDDEYEEWYEKWLEAFGGNLVDEFMPFNKLPILSDFYDLAKELLSILGVDTYGNPPQSVFMQWYDSLAKGVEILYDKFSGEDTHYTYYGGIYKLLQAVSSMSGLPMAMVTREIVTAWNNIVGAMAPSLKVKTYDPGEKNEIKYAYQDGYLSFDEAIEQLVKQELVDNENEAYFTVSEWEAGDGYSRYDAVYEAVRTGGDISAAMDELTSHGYTEKDVLSQVMTQIGKWYYDEESDYRITKQQAIDMLSKYTKLTDEEITKKVNKWSCVVVTGVKYDDIDDEFVEGKITASRAIDMYVRYGGMTKEDATNKVAVYSFVKKHPSLDGENISYSFVSAYTEYCEPQGIDVDVFRDVWQYNSSVEGDKDKKGNTISGSKKAKVLNYIDSLRLSKKQKDSLYYAFGYSASKIREAPWH